MLKKAPWVLVVSLLLGTGACTSKKQATDTADADVAEMTAEGGDADAAETADALESTDDLGGNEGLSADLDGENLSPDEQLPEDKPAGDAIASDDVTLDEFADNQTDPNAPQEKLAEQTPAPTMEEPAPAPTPAPEPMPEPQTAGLVPTPMEEPAPEEPKVIAPLRKIADAPYKQSGILVNTVYLARDGDTLESVSQKIYGSDKTKDLVKVNPRYESKPVKVGDKIYYNSPNRPADDTKLITFYEDIGLSPLVYVTKPNDNIRALGKDLLGNEGSWKELYSTNMNVESKGDLPEGTEIRYWANTDMATAMNTPPPPPAQEMTPPPPPSDELQNMNPPPPPPDMAANENLPPPPAAGTMDVPPPPPEPMNEPPPPPPAVEAPVAKAPGEESGGSLLASLSQDPDQQMAMGMGAVLILAALALLIVIQKKKKARRSQIDFNTSTQTQIE